MNDAFEPLKISKSNVWRCVSTVASAFLGSPWVIFLSAVMYVAFHLVLSGNVRVEPELTGWDLIQIPLLYIILIQVPALLSSYMMYREGYGVSFRRFVLLLRDQKYHIHCMAVHIGIIVAIVLLRILMFSTSTQEASAAEDVASQVWLTFNPLEMVFYAGVMYVLMKELVEIRWPSDPDFASIYVTKAIKMNLNALFINVALITVLENLVPSILYGLPIGGAIKWVFFILSGMFWTYVLFGNTFKKKESADKVIHSKMQSESTW